MTAVLEELGESTAQAPQEFRQFFGAISKMAADLFVRFGTLKHVYHVVYGDRMRLATFVPRYRTDDDKDLIAKAMREHIQRLNADFYVSVSETWMLHLGPGEAIRRPTTASDRIEALTIEGYARDGDWITSHRKIERDVHGKPWLQAPETQSRDTSPANEITGRFASFFKPDTPEQEPRYGDTIH